MIDFQPSEEQALVKASVADFAKGAFEERARAFETAGEVAPEVIAQARELGISSLLLPESAGGQGLGMVVACLVEEELAASDAATASVVGASSFVLASLAFGLVEGAPGAVLWSEEKPHPTRAGFVTTASEQGGEWTLEGTKCFVSGATAADRFLVFAQIDETAGWRGLGAFLVEKGAEGLSIGPRHATLGLDAVPFHSVALRRVPAKRVGEGDLTDLLLVFFAKLAVIVAARAVGVSRRAFDLAREHCDTRIAFGKPIGHFQAVAFTIADRLMDVESSRWLVQRAAAAWDGATDPKSRQHALLCSARAGASALEAAMRTTDDCVQLHGGSGFVRDVIAEKLMRDAKQLALCAPTAEILDQLASAIELGRPLDPALVLPTPDSQAIFV